MDVKLYGTLAGWYTLLTPPEEYEEEAQWYAEKILEYAQRDVRRVLELGCGSGANASFLKRRFEMVLVDLSPQMLEECRKINPELAQHVGDMRTYRHGETFDAVFVHDAISYMTTIDDVRAAAQTAAAHLDPGGVALLCPDDLRENFTPGLDSGGSDGPDGRGVRYLAWSIEGSDEDTVFTDYAYMLKSSDGSVQLAHDRHITGRFPTAVWVEALEAAGLTATVIPLEHTEVDPGDHHVLVGRKPV